MSEKHPPSPIDQPPPADGVLVTSILSGTALDPTNLEQVKATPLAEVVTAIHENPILFAVAAKKLVTRGDGLAFRDRNEFRMAIRGLAGIGHYERTDTSDVTVSKTKNNTLGYLATGVGERAVAIVSGETVHGRKPVDSLFMGDLPFDAGNRSLAELTASVLALPYGLEKRLVSLYSHDVLDVIGEAVKTLRTMHTESGNERFELRKSNDSKRVYYGDREDVLAKLRPLSDEEVATRNAAISSETVAAMREVYLRLDAQLATLATQE